MKSIGFLFIFSKVIVANEADEEFIKQLVCTQCHFPPMLWREMQMEGRSSLTRTRDVDVLCCFFNRSDRQNKQGFPIERLRLLFAAALHPSFAVGRSGAGVCVVAALPKKRTAWLRLWNITNTLTWQITDETWINQSCDITNAFTQCH